MTSPLDTLEKLLGLAGDLVRPDGTLEPGYEGMAAVALTEIVAAYRALDDPAHAEDRTCFRCDTPIEPRLEEVWLDGQGRNDCPGGDEGMPHEADPPDGWDG